MSSSDTGESFRFKVVLLGDARVGKTSIKNRVMGKGYNQKYFMTVGVDFSLKEMKGHSLLIWDLAGQKGFDQIRSNYYKGAKGAVLVYDITMRESFDNLARWIEEMKNHSEGNVPIILAGNKVDLRDSTDEYITVQEGKEKAIELANKFNNSVFFIETSALTGYNIEKAFELLLDKMIEDLKANEQRS
ncbi:MAG: GTP-binding protein [Methanobacteriota archaeon]|nr:MAG: GTP-binding protein [Euryarchaeota archaeon]